MENNDISKRTVLVLLVLTLVVSVVGTWTILSQPTTIYKNVEIDNQEPGKVSVGILGPSTATEPVVQNTGGRVGVSILK